MSTPTVPSTIHTSRLLLRAWHPRDAATLKPLLERNVEYLAPWIPAHAAQPAPLPELEQRLAGYASDFSADNVWRYAVYDLDGETLLGAASLHPRVEHERVPYADSDRVEMGYWIRQDTAGRGYATEAARGLLATASVLPRFGMAEIRCDERNTLSAAVPRRLGFTLRETLIEAGLAASESTIALQVWALPAPFAPEAA